MGANQAIGDATQNNIGTAAAAAGDGTGGNGVTADAAFKITGGLGTETLSIAANATAAKIASQVNGESSKTGVSATASTNATIDNVSAGSVQFTLASRNEAGEVVGTAKPISAVIASSDDLSALRDAINAETASTGITATLNGAGDGIELSNTTGHDITIENATDGVAAAGDVMDVDGVTLADGGATDSVVISGKVEFSASDAFLITTTNTDIMAAASTSSKLSSVADVDVSTREGANNALTVIDEALSFVTDTRADLGAIQNRLESTISNLQNISENVSAARSRVQDADFAAETANLTKNQILQQAGLSILSQANSAPNNVLSLLQ
jgi:flagellin